MTHKNYMIALLCIVSVLACEFTNELSLFTSSAAETPTREPTRRISALPSQSPVLPTPPAAPPIAIVITPTPAEISGTANDNANIRSLPSTGAPIAARITKGQALRLTGRTAASDWYQVRLPANPNAQGWILGSLVRAEGTNRLPVVQPGNVPPPYPRP